MAFVNKFGGIIEFLIIEYFLSVGMWSHAIPRPKGNLPAETTKMMSEQEYLGMHAGAKPELFRFAEKLRANMTEAEKKLWEFLRLKPKGFKFRRQHPLGRYILDFYCHKAKLAIEIDGKYHELSEQKKLDETRTNEIEGSWTRESSGLASL